MATWQPVVILRSYVSQHPPGVTFFLCLLSLSLSLFCLRSFGQTHILPNPDTTKDWNHILSSLSQVQLCLEANVSSVGQVAPVVAPQPVSPTKTPVTRLHLKVPLIVTYSSGSHALKSLGLQSTLVTSQLGLGGNETVNVTLHVLPEPKGNDMYTCLTISVPTNLLPLTPLPPECHKENGDEKVISPVHVVSLETSKQLHLASSTCYSLQSQHDPTLTVMLTQEQQDVAGRHLLEVSVCLLAVCLMFCLSTCLTHSATHRSNGLDLHSLTEPLFDS